MQHTDDFASILTVNDEHTQLPPFSKLIDNSLSEINCTEHEIETIIEALNPNKARGDDGISHKMFNGVSKSVSKPLCIYTANPGRDPIQTIMKVFFPNLLIIFQYSFQIQWWIGKLTLNL